MRTHSPRLHILPKTRLYFELRQSLGVLEPRFGIHVQRGFHLEQSQFYWPGNREKTPAGLALFRSSLHLIPKKDGSLLLDSLHAQKKQLVEYPMNEKKIRTGKAMIFRKIANQINPELILLYALVDDKCYKTTFVNFLNKCIPSIGSVRVD